MVSPDNRIRIEFETMRGAYDALGMVDLLAGMLGHTLMEIYDKGMHKSAGFDGFYGFGHYVKHRLCLSRKQALELMWLACPDHEIFQPGGVDHEIAVKFDRARSEV